MVVPVVVPYVIAFSDNVSALAAEIGDLFGCGYESPGVLRRSVADSLRFAFIERRPIIAVGSVAIVVRVLAPLLRDKREESAVLVVDGRERHVICLLGGHHGGNGLARRVAVGIGGRAVITTAGDDILGEALENPPSGWGTSGDVKVLLQKALGGEKLRLYDPYGLSYLPSSCVESSLVADADVVISDRSVDFGDSVFGLHPAILSLGIGCERFVDSERLCVEVGKFLRDRGLSEASVAAVASLDIKADEPALAALASMLEVDVRLFTASELRVYDGYLANPSAAVLAEVGCAGVAESSCLAVFGGRADLVVEKVKFKGFTVAVARSRECFSSSTLSGVKVGRLDIVGIGPGSWDFRTLSASAALLSADIVVGYGLYLDLCGDLIVGKERLSFALGEERLRSLRALQLASEGHRVALVCSGDAGIYALASVVYACLGETEDRLIRAVDVCVHPGISAFQLLSARSGALFGDDFCLISLSDLQVSADVIRHRIGSAIAGDFAIAFYNPQSMRRRDLLAYAVLRLREGRDADTPVVIGRNLGREGESVVIVRLADFEVDSVDMLTLVMVGNSQSRMLDLKGAKRVYTSRICGEMR